MKKIGILGGTSWPSTMLYYEGLQKQYSQLSQSQENPEIILYSINYHAIKSLYTVENGWEIIPNLLLEELKKLWALPIDGFIIANNTLHRAYDILVAGGKINGNPPIFHALALTALKAKQQNHQKILLLGTPATMEHSFFKDYFINQNIEVIIPNDEDRQTIGAVQKKAAIGEITPQGNAKFMDIVEKYAPQVDAIVLGCTELPLMMPKNHNFKTLNPTEIQCEEAVKFLLI